MAPEPARDAENVADHNPKMHDSMLAIEKCDRCNGPMTSEPVQPAESVVAEALVDSNHHGYITEEWAAELAHIAVAGLLAAGLLIDGGNDAHGA